MPDPEPNREQAESHYYDAIDRVADGDMESAIASFRLSVAADPTFHDASHGLIRTLQDAGHLDEAIAAALALSAAAPEDILVHTRLSILYQLKGMVPEAEAESTRAKVLGWKQQLAGNAPSPFTQL